MEPAKRLMFAMLINAIDDLFQHGQPRRSAIAWLERGSSQPFGVRYVLKALDRDYDKLLRALSSLQEDEWVKIRATLLESRGVVRRTTTLRPHKKRRR